MHAKTRVVILHSNVLLRQGLVELSRRFDTVEVVGDTADLEDALAACRSQRPHVALVEAAGTASLDVCRRVHAALPLLPLVLLGSSRDLAYIMRAFRAGGTIYVPPDVPMDGLARCLEDAHAHGREAGPYLARPPRQPQQDASPISRREREVLALIAQGKANKEIGRALSISENTVRNHIVNIFGKLGVKDRTEAAVHAIKRGLV